MGYDNFLPCLVTPKTVSEVGQGVKVGFGRVFLHMHDSPIEVDVEGVVLHTSCWSSCNEISYVLGVVY